MDIARPPVPAQVCRLTLSDFWAYCKTGEIPPSMDWLANDSPISQNDLMRLLWSLGWLAPSSWFTPGPCDIETNFDQPFCVEGSGVPGKPSSVSFQICPPSAAASLMVKDLIVEPKNLTAQESGVVEMEFKSLSRLKDPCVPTERADCPGQFTTMSNFVIPCGGAALVVTMKNLNPFSRACFRARWRGWRSP